MLAKRHAALAQQAERRLIQWLKVSGSNPLGRKKNPSKTADRAGGYMVLSEALQEIMKGLGPGSTRI